MSVGTSLSSLVLPYSLGKDTIAAGISEPQMDSRRRQVVILRVMRGRWSYPSAPYLKEQCCSLGTLLGTYTQVQWDLRLSTPRAQMQWPVEEGLPETVGRLSSHSTGTRDQ